MSLAVDIVQFRIYSGKKVGDKGLIQRLQLIYNQLLFISISLWET
jgi:hypothetical protein